MGRISMPMMNKTGYSMYWNSMWDDKLNYSRAFKEDILIKIFFNLFIEGGYTFVIRHKIKNFDLHLKMLKNRYNLHILKKKKDETRFNYFIDPKKNIKSFLSKVWLLKYQNWIVFYFFVYSPDLGGLKKPKKKKQKIKKKQYNYIINRYYYNFFRINYSYNYFSEYSLKKLNF